MKPRHPLRARRRTNRQRRLLLLAVCSALLAVAGLAVTAVGIYAWTSPRQAPVQVVKGQGVELTATPLFDPGVTLFSSPTKSGAPAPLTAFDCRITHPGEPDRVPATASDPAVIGSRVREGVSLMPVLDLGAPQEGDRLLCQGSALDNAAVWVLPTTPSVPTTAMSVVVGGIGLIGMSVLVNPRARGFRPR